MTKKLIFLSTFSFLLVTNAVLLTLSFSYLSFTILLILNSIFLNLTVVFYVKNKITLISLLTVSNLFFGSFGFYVLSGFQASIVDCIYMTIITLSTVGFSEVITSGHFTMIRIFTIYVIVMGLGNLLLVLSSISKYLIEGKLQEIFERRKLMAKIQSMKNHIIICGGGVTAEHIMTELIKTKREFVLIESDPSRCKELELIFPTSIIFNGDATEDNTLLNVGIETANSLVAILPLDKDNLFLTITTKHLNKSCRVVSKTLNLSNKNKLMRAGASSVVPNRYISALRLVSEVISPNVVTFLDTMMRSGTHRVIDIIVQPSSKYCGKTINEFSTETELRFNVISLKYADSSSFNYNPSPSDIIKENMVLFFIASPAERKILATIINSSN